MVGAWVSVAVVKSRMVVLVVSHEMGVEEVAKHSFTISHLKSQDNVLADRGSRRTNLIELTDEEKELFGDVIEECEDKCEGEGGTGAGNLAGSRGEKRKKGEPRQRPPMTAEQIARCKAQQLKQLATLL